MSDIYENEFQNWLKGVLAQKKTRKALCENVEQKLKDFISKLPAGQREHLDQFIVCLNENGILQFNKPKKSEHGRKKRKTEMSYKHDLCKTLYELFKAQHEEKKPVCYEWSCSSESKESDPSKHSLNEGEKIWRIAMLYMFVESGDNIASCHCLNQLDISKLLKMMRNCSLFVPDGSVEFYDEIIEFRNYLMHSPDNKVNEKYLVEKLEKARKLLEILGLAVECVAVIQYLKKLAENDFIISYHSEEHKHVVDEVIKATVIAVDLHEVIDTKGEPYKDQSRHLKEILEQITKTFPDPQLQKKPNELKQLAIDSIEEKKEALEIDKTICAQSSDEGTDSVAYKKFEDLQKHAEQDVKYIEEQLKTPIDEDLVKACDRLNKEVKTLKEDKKIREIDRENMTKLIYQQAQDLAKLKKDKTAMQAEVKNSDVVFDEGSDLTVEESANISSKSSTVEDNDAMNVSTNSQGQQSYVTVPPSEVQKVSATNRDSTIDVPETLETVQQLQRDDGNDVSSNIRLDVVTVEDVDDKSLDGEKPPPIPPKSKVVLESLKSFSVVDGPLYIPQESNAVERGKAGEDLDSNIDRSSTGHGMTDVLPNSLPPSQFVPSQPFQIYGQQQIPPYQQNQQHQVPFYLQQQQQAPLGQYNYNHESGNAPYPIYNPNMHPGMFYQNPGMQNYQQPYRYNQNYGTAQVQTPDNDAGYSSHQYARQEDTLYEEIGQPNRADHTTSTVQAEHHLSSSADHRKIYNQESEEPITEPSSGEKSSQSPERRSMSNPTNTPQRKQDPRKDENKIKPKEDVVKGNEEVFKEEDYYLYFKGINPDTGRENLSNFTEVATKGESEPEKIIFNHSRTCALVTVSLDKKPDLSKVEERIHRRGIDGKKPEVFVVQPPDSIAVSSDEDIKNTESLALYFESRKAGGSDLKQDPYESEDGSCFVIQFEGPDVVKRVCARQAPHEWEGQKLRVSPYYECEAGAIWDSELHVVKIPRPVDVSLQRDYLAFLQRDCCKQLLANLESNHCAPLFTDEGLKLECTLTSKTPRFRTLVKIWEDSSRRIVEAYISENVVERTMQSSDQVWEELMTFFKAEKIQEKVDLVTNEDKSSFVVLLVGFKASVKHVLTKLGEKQKEIEKRLRRKSKTIAFNALKLRLLDTVGVFEEVKKETDDVEIYIGDGDVTVEGQPDDISTLQVRMHEADSKISESKWEHGFSPNCVDFIKRKLFDNISSLLKRNSITAEWEISKRYIKLYVYEGRGSGYSKDDDYEEVRDDMHSNVDDVSAKAKDLLKSAVVEMQLNVQDGTYEVLTSPEWTSFFKSMTEEYENVAEFEFQETTTTIFIHGMKKEAQDICSKVKAFLEENAVIGETVNCGTISVRFFNRKELAASLDKKFEHLKVRIVMNDENVIIRGTKAGIAETKKELMKVCNSIICDKYTIQKVAVKDVFRDVKEHGLIDVVEKETGCLIQFLGENETFLGPGSADDLDDSDDANKVAANIKAATGFSQAKAPPRENGFKAANGIKVTLGKGELGQQDGDVIVVTTSSSLDMSSGNACKSVFRAGGQRLQDECKEKYTDGIKFGDIAVIHGGGSLECNRVYLTTLPHWSSDNNPKQVLENIMKDSLELASKFKKCSIVFAAMGTGQLKYPTDLVAMLMYQAVIDFDQNNPKTTLKDVRFVLYQKDFQTIKGFEAEEQLRLGGGGDRSTFDLKQGNLTIELSDENIAQQKVDGILCSTSPNMDLSHNGACLALLRAGGKSLQDECKSKYDNKLGEGQVVEIGGGNLSCKCVFLTVLPDFSPDAIGILTNIIQTALKLAQARSLTSLALPALGTGFLKYPKDEVCKCMFNAVTDWAQSNPNTTIKTVRFVMHAKDHSVIQMFKSYIVNAKRRDKREGRHSVMNLNAPTKTPAKAASPQSDTYSALKDENGVMAEENRKKLMEQISSVDVHIYSDSKENIDECKKELDAQLEKLYTKRKINDYKEIIKSLTEEEMKMLDIVALANINIDTQIGIISIDGPMKQVSDVIHELKAHLLKIERRRHDTSAAEELHKIVQWQYEEVTETEFKLIPYSKKLNQLIEKAYKANMNEFEFEDDDGETFVIDFQQLIEYRKYDDQDKLRVLRKDILISTASALPEDWANMKDNENIQVVALQTTDQTYKDIEQRLINEVKTGSYAHRLNFDPGNLQVNKIERIQNKTLYQQYQAKKKQMTDQKPNLPSNMPIERELWHGTKFDTVTSIQMHGFNRSYSSNANGQPWYGDGVYFSANASYSARGWLSGAGAGNKGYIFLVNTLTGHLHKGQKGMRYLPAVDPKDPTLLYDSAIDDPANPMEFVIFNDTQAYPAYIITFTT